MTRDQIPVFNSCSMDSEFGMSRRAVVGGIAGIIASIGMPAMPVRAASSTSARVSLADCSYEYAYVYAFN